MNCILAESEYYNNTDNYETVSTTKKNNNQYNISFYLSAITSPSSKITVLETNMPSITLNKFAFDFTFDIGIAKYFPDYGFGIKLDYLPYATRQYDLTDDAKSRYDQTGTVSIESKSKNTFIISLETIILNTKYFNLFAGIGANIQQYYFKIPLNVSRYTSDVKIDQSTVEKYLTTSALYTTTTNTSTSSCNLVNNSETVYIDNSNNITNLFSNSLEPMFQKEDIFFYKELNLDYNLSPVFSMRIEFPVYRNNFQLFAEARYIFSKNESFIVNSKSFLNTDEQNAIDKSLKDQHLFVGTYREVTDSNIKFYKGAGCNNKTAACSANTTTCSEVNSQNVKQYSATDTNSVKINSDLVKKLKQGFEDAGANNEIAFNVSKNYVYMSVGFLINI